MFVGLFALLVGLPLLRLKGHYFAVATLGVAEGLREVVINTSSLTGGGAGITVPSFGDAPTPWLGNDGFYLLFLGLAVAVVAAGLLIATTRSGYALRAIHQDEDAAAAMGVNTTLVKTLAFAGSAALTGAIGAAYAFQQVTFYPDRLFDVEITVLMVVMVILGGAGTVVGPVIGAVVVAYGSEYLRQHLPTVHTLVLGALIVVAVILLPAGVRELPARSHPAARVLVAPQRAQVPAVTAVLRARGLTKTFGGLHAIREVDLDLEPGRLLGVIGPNGAGKSTLVNLITGHLRPTAGTVEIDGRNLTGARPWRIAHAGVARTFQIVKPFRAMTVEENVMVAAFFGGSRPTGAVARREAHEILGRVGLGGREQLTPSELSVADARRLELAKALALKPRVLLLDEVLAGLRPAEIDPALQLIASLREEGLALLMVEHVVQAIAAVSDEVLVLHHGVVLTSGPPAQVLADDRVVEAYLGARYAARAAARQRAGES